MRDRHGPRQFRAQRGQFLFPSGQGCLFLRWQFLGRERRRRLTLEGKEIPRASVCPARKVAHDIIGHTPGASFTVALVDFQFHDRRIAAMVFAFRQNRHLNQIADLDFGLRTRNILLTAVVDFTGGERLLAVVEHPLDAVAAFIIGIRDATAHFHGAVQRTPPRQSSRVIRGRMHRDAVRRQPDGNEFERCVAGVGDRRRQVGAVTQVQRGQHRFVLRAARRFVQ